MAPASSIGAAAGRGRTLRLRMFRELWEAEVAEESPYDPKNERIRADG